MRSMRRKPSRDSLCVLSRCPRTVSTPWSEVISNQFVLHVDLPGVDPKAVEITSDQGVLTVRGQRESTHKESREGFRRIERISGEFQRRFSLPESADAQNIKAKVANGVLEVAIPKLAQVQPHKITVEAA